MSDKHEASANEDFESVTVTFKHNGKDRTFEVREISGGLANKLTAPLTHQDAAIRAAAVEKYSNNLIAASVYENGEKLTYQQAYDLPNRITKRLVTEINKINGADNTQEAEAAKNA